MIEYADEQYEFVSGLPSDFISLIEQAGDNEQLEKDIDAVYRDRNLLACALVESCGSGVMGGWSPDETVSDEWAIVWLETPMGQMSWHVPREMANSLVTRNDGYEYDGHDREIKNDRLASWAEEGCWR
jgi:hypothetical protein